MVPEEKIHEMDQLLEEEGLATRGLTWEQLGTEVGLDISGATIKRAMGTLQYKKCLACRRGWVSKSTAEKRLKYARVMSEKYPDIDD